jgi:hypothetical protein
LDSAEENNQYETKSGPRELCADQVKLGKVPNERCDPTPENYRHHSGYGLEKKGSHRWAPENA